jgi:hypothetical protein
MNNPQPWWLTWPVTEVAAAILPFFSSSPSQNEKHAMGSIVSGWKTGEYRAPVFRRSRFDDPDYRAVAEAIQVLERAGLLMRALYTRHRVGSGDIFSSGFDVGLTRLGWHALQTNTVRQHLGLGGVPPPMGSSL